MKEATLYYCHLVRQAADPEYKKREYYKKFIGLVNNLSAENLRGPIEDLKTAYKVLDRGVIYSFNRDGGTSRALGLNMYNAIRALSPSTKEIESIKERLLSLIVQPDEPFSYLKSRISRVLYNTHLIRYAGIDKEKKQVFLEILDPMQKLKTRKYSIRPSFVLDNTANGALSNANNRFNELYRADPAISSLFDETGISPNDLKILLEDIFRQASANSKKGED